MFSCYKCKCEFPSQRILDMHSNRCNGIASRSANPVTRLSKPVTAESRKPSGRLQPSVSCRDTPDQKTPINLEAYLGGIASILMGLVIWGCYIALATMVGYVFWPLLLISGLAMTTGIVSIVSRQSPNDLAISLYQNRKESWKGILLAGGLSLALSLGMYLSTNLFFGGPGSI